MAKITAYFSAQNKDIVAVAGDGLEEGNLALCISGCKAVPVLATKADAEQAIPYLKEDMERMGSLVFLLNGGALNANAAADMEAAGYAEVATFELDAA